MRSHFLRGKGTGLIYVGGVSTAVAQSQNYTINLASLTGGIASSPAANDLIVICNGVTSSSDQSFNAGVVTSGFTQLTALTSADTRQASMWVSWKLAAGNETTITVRGNNTGSNYGNAAIAHVWRNVSLATPIDVTTTTATGTNSSRPNVPSITPTTPGAIVLGCGYGTQGTTSGAFTAPAGTSQVVTANIDATTGGASGIIAAYRSWMSGAYDMAAFTGGTTSTSDSWCAAAVVIRPAR